MSIAALLALLVAGCANDYGPKQGVGTLAGGVAGGLLGSTIGHGSGRLVAVGAGTLLGAFLGGELGRSLDKADQMYAERTANQAFEYNRTGQPAEWRNPDSGHYGTVTPTRTYQQSSGQPCREYQTTVYVGGRAENAYGTACRDLDGSWRIVS